MHKQAEVIDVSELDVEDILQLVDASDTSGKWALDPEQFWLTTDVACECLHKGFLSQAEVMALLSGLNPITAGVYGCYSYLDPQGQDMPAAERMLNDIKSGRVGIPMTNRELIESCKEWEAYLPDPLREALKQTDGARNDDDNVEQQINKPLRTDSAEIALAEVHRCMDQATGLIKAAGLARADGKLPGTKPPYFDYLRAHSGRLRDLGDDRLAEYLKMAGNKWSQSGTGRGKADIQLRAALGLSQEISKKYQTDLSPAMGKSSKSDSTWLTKIPPKS